MESNITLSNVQKEMWRIEKFVEEVADEFNIFNSYYSNILVSLVEVAQAAGNEGNTSLSFRPERKGLVFSVEADFLGLEQDSNVLFLIRKLSDNVMVKQNFIELTFSIHSMNKELSARRRDAFHEYLSGINVSQEENNEI